MVSELSLFSHQSYKNHPIYKTMKTKKDLDEKISFLSSKLLVSEEKLYQKYIENKKEFKNYYINKLEKYGSLLEEALKEYNSIIKNYIEDNHKIIKLHVRGALTSIYKELVMKIVRKALLQLSKIPQGFDAHFRVKLNKENISWNVLAGKDALGELQIVKWAGKVEIDREDLNFLGKGRHGIIQKVFHLNTGDFAVIKFSNLGASEVIEREVAKLEEIHIDKVRHYFPFPSKKIFHIQNSDHIEVGMMQKFFSHGDLITALDNGVFNNLTRQVWLEVGLQLFSGVAILHKKMVHRDIKLDNCFVDDVNGRLRIVIGDFGSVMNFAEIDSFVKENKIDSSMVLTPGYLTNTDYQKEQVYRKSKDYQNAIKNYYKRDVFSAAVVLWSIVANTFPYITKEIFPDTTKLLGRKQVRERLGSEVKGILFQCLSEEPEKRPSARNVVSFLKKQLEKSKRAST